MNVVLYKRLNTALPNFLKQTEKKAAKKKSNKLPLSAKIQSPVPRQNSESSEINTFEEFVPQQNTILAANEVSAFGGGYGSLF